MSKTPQQLVEHWREKAADYLRMASNMRCASMAEAKSGYVGRAAFATMAADQLANALKANEPEVQLEQQALAGSEGQGPTAGPRARARRRTSDVQHEPLAEAESPATGDGTAVQDVPSAGTGDSSDGV